ncbi:hypothetical protein MMC22_010603 [Lobaria immixta]|nr:hypothetical protein [Lobaria immixta]
MRHEGRALAATKAIELSSFAGTTEATTTTSKTAMPGVLRYIHLDLADRSTIPASAGAFLAAESRLDVLWNNAGVLLQAPAPFCITCVGPFLLTKLPLPPLTATTRQSVAGPAAGAGGVRIVWTSSIFIDLFTPKGGLRIPELSTPASSALTRSRCQRDASSKAGNWFLASELARRLCGTDAEAIVSLIQNPGNLRLNVFRHTSSFIHVESHVYRAAFANSFREYSTSALELDF